MILNACVDLITPLPFLGGGKSKTKNENKTPVDMPSQEKSSSITNCMCDAANVSLACIPRVHRYQQTDSPQVKPPLRELE